MENQRKGLVFNLIHGSFVDGYGVRTTVFLKGCPLRCIWCCNPEGQSYQPELRVTCQKCDGCGRCVTRCAKGALSIKNGLVSVDRARCDGCYACVEACYTGALDTFGTWYTADKLMEILMRDLSFYRSTGGGVTIGGGEATGQPEFLLEILERCRQEGIHTALDTCGYVTTNLGKKALETADLLLFDIKGLNPERHKEYTGLQNDVILENLRRLSGLRRPMIIRLPVIPGYTDDQETLEAEARLLAELKSVERVDILPVHEFGRVKYEQLGLRYRLRAEPIPEQRQEEIRQLFASIGLKAQIGG